MHRKQYSFHWKYDYFNIHRHCFCLRMFYNEILLIMIGNFVVNQQLQCELQNEDDHLIQFSLPQAPRTTTGSWSRFNPKHTLTKFAVFISITIFAFKVSQRFFEQKNLRLDLTYPVQTVGLHAKGQQFNFSEVTKKQKYQFQSRLAEMLQPFNSTNCELDSFGRILLCSNLIQHSSAVVGFTRQQQNSEFYCKLQKEYNITSFISVCKAIFDNQCDSISPVIIEQCLAQINDRIFFTHYTPYKEAISPFKLIQKTLIVKMTVHQTEWASFRSMPLQELDRIDQLILQIYLQDSYLWGNIETLNTILTKFYPVNLHMDNRYCREDRFIETKIGKIQSAVFTVTLINKDIIQLKQNTRSYQLHDKNRRVQASLRDCQMPYTFQIAEQKVEMEQIPWDEQNLHSLTLQHVHAKRIYDEPTVGMYVSSRGFNYQKIEQNDRIAYYNFIAELFKPYNDTDCQYARYGNMSDQGYVICKNMLNASVAMLDFGIEGSDSFGCQLTSDFNMPNLQYDCTSNKKPFCRTNNYANHYYYACISQRTETIPTLNRTFYSIRDVIDRHQLKGKHITMKIDIQGNEWPSFRSLPVSYLEFVDQLIIQFHLFQSSGYFIGNYDILQTLGELFYPVNFHQNNYNCWLHSRSKLRSSVFEVTLVNKQLLQLHSKSRSYTPNSLNKPNTKSFPDCQIDPSQ